MKVKFWNPDRLYLSHKEEFDTAIQKTLSEGNFILRQDVEDFEKAFAEFLNVKHVVGVASGTDALILSLAALGNVKDNDVLVPAHTFRGTVEAVHHAGGRPIVVDRGDDPEMQMTSNTVAAIPAHIAGEILDWDVSVPMIEDACQAVGARPLKGISACYSFYPAKILGCFGDGGAIATNDDKFAAKLRLLRNHSKDDWSGYGYNSRLDNVQAAVLNVKLKYLPEALKKRKEIADKYNAITKQPARDIYQDYIIECKTDNERYALWEFLNDRGIEAVRNQYPFPEQSPKGILASGYESRTLRIPCNETMTDEEVQYVVDKLKEFYGK